VAVVSVTEILDTFPEFLAYWQDCRELPIDAQIEGWLAEYMAPWPQLSKMQIDEYESEGDDWREIAKEHVFSTLDQRLQDMEIAHDNLLKICPSLVEKARAIIELDADLILVVYVGIGLGAGWATTYDGRPAILFGLENIAECGWINEETLSGLLSHEYGHLTHFQQRKEAGRQKGSGPWWQLYTEGYAMRIEDVIMGESSWHMRERGGAEDWLDWCNSHARWLAAEFIRRVECGESVRPFFGSWYDLRGYTQTGYFLGHELIRSLEAKLSLNEIALIDTDDPLLVEGLQQLLENG
jgi:hypothetical protein